MGCNCKKDKTKEETNQEKKVNKTPLILRGFGIFFKTIIFVVASIITGIVVVPFSIYLLFKTIFLEESIDFTGILLTMAGKLKRKEQEDDDDDYDEDDYEDDEFEFENEHELVLLDEK